MNKFIITMEFDYDQYSVVQHYPCITKYAKKEFIDEFQRIFNLVINDEDEYEDYFEYRFKHLSILDTGFRLQNPHQLFTESGLNIIFVPPIILSIDEWFERYGNELTHKI